MNRWIWLCVCAVLGLVMLVCGLLVPAHLRAVDASVIEQAGRNSVPLTEQGLALVSQQQFGPAELLLQAASQQKLAGADRLGLAVGILAKEYPALQVWGCPEPRLEKLATPKHLARGAEPFTDLVVRLENRGPLLEFLQASPQPAVQELLRCRSLTNTVLLPPSPSSSGQAFDAAVTIGGLLLERGYLTTGLRNSITALAAAAHQGGNTQPLEEVLLDLMSLGQRLTWGQLVAFLAHTEQPDTLRLQAALVRKADAQLPVLFSAVQLSANPAAVTRYLAGFSQSGLQDLAAALPYGAGGVNELLQRNQRWHSSRISAERFAPGLGDALAAFAWRTPWLALAVKWLLYLGSGFLLAMAMHFAWPAVSALERPLQVRGFHLARESLFALGFLLVVLLLSEPFLAQETQKADFSFRLRLSTVGSVVSAQHNNNVHGTIMNQLSLMTLLLFFVLQALIYTACLFKLAEIRRQRVPARMKLKLLENEDHLFDAGLYLGFVGTIISLILVSLGIIKPSLMAAYSSTSFGILFVSFFKIFNLRPVRRRLLLEAETAPAEPTAPAGKPSLAL